uniref:Uncharacterized protein n=1 Tax=Arundo donax TaxID=35708 RepID=A0A0A9FFE3_ARUDO
MVSICTTVFLQTDLNSLHTRTVKTENITTGIPFLQDYDCQLLDPFLP